MRTDNRLRAGVLLALAIGLLVYGAAIRTHVVRDPAAGGKTYEVGDPLVIQGSCIGAVHQGSDGVLEGNPSTWEDTAGKECPT